MNEQDYLQLSWQEENRPYSRYFEDHFYSQKDGRAETVHVFLSGNNLPQRWQFYNSFQLAELGFGTGLNFLETWRYWRRHRSPGQHLNFTSFEAYPLTADDIIRAISAWPGLAELAAALVKHMPALASTPVTWELDAQTTLMIVRAPALEGVRCWHKKAHAWYLDGFSPSCNRDMWSSELMAEVYTHTHTNGTFATYTAAGWVRRNLQASGFIVKKVPGHAGKRHMLTGVRK